MVFWAGAVTGSVGKSIKELVRKSETMSWDRQRPLRYSLLTITGVTVSGKEPEGSVGIAYPLEQGSTRTGVGLASHHIC